MSQNRPQTQTLFVPHLGGIDIGYRLSAPTVDKSKPTLVLYNPFTATAEYYNPEFENAALTKAANLLAVEPLGHGRTHLHHGETYTYWDTAVATIQLLDKLGVDRFFAAGTSQGGWIAVRLGLLAPSRIQGIVPIASSMDSESAHSRTLGNWDGPTATAGFVTQAGSTAPDPDFEPGDGYYDFLLDVGFGPGRYSPATRDLWAATIRDNYRGDAGKRRIVQAAVNIATRESIHARLPYVRSPVLWFQGTDDIVFSVKQAEEDIKLFTHSVDARLVQYEGGVHFLSSTHAEALHAELIKFIEKWNKN